MVDVLQWTIDFSTLITAVYWLAAAVAVFSLLLVCGVNVMRRSARLRDERLKAFRYVWSAVLGPDADPRRRLPTVAPEELATAITMWNRAKEAAYHVCDPASAQNRHGRLDDIARRLRFERRCLRLLRGHDVAMQLLAVEMLGYLQCTSATPALRGLIDSPNPVLSFAAARSMLQMHEGFAERFVMLITQRADWSPAKLYAVVGEEVDSLASPMADIVRTSPPVIARQLVQYLALVNPAITLPVVHHLFRTVTDAPTIAAALKVLAALGTAGDAPVAATFAGNDDWHVRVQVANSLGKLGDIAQIPVVTNLLDDSHWWVRYRAAQALALLSHDDEGRLRTILKHITDRYGRDILTQIIAEREPVFQGEKAS